MTNCCLATLLIKYSISTGLSPRMPIVIWRFKLLFFYTGEKITNVHIDVGYPTSWFVYLKYIMIKWDKVFCICGNIWGTCFAPVKYTLFFFKCKRRWKVHGEKYVLDVHLCVNKSLKHCTRAESSRLHISPSSLLPLIKLIQTTTL